MLSSSYLKRSKTQSKITTKKSEIVESSPYKKGRSNAPKFSDKNIINYSVQDLKRQKMQQNFMKKTISFGKGIKWKETNQCSGYSKNKGNTKHEMIKSQSNVDDKSICLSRAACHRRINSSFKISDKLKTMSSIFRNNPQNFERSKTEHEYEQSNPFKIFRYTNTFKHKKKVSKLDDLMGEQKLQTQKKIIKEVQQMRKTSKLIPNPKQWQFFNCLSLQKIQLYQTNLKISCEGWIAIDRLQIKYLRGWHPKRQDDFTPSIRFFIFLICQSLHDQEIIDLDELFIRLNEKHVTYVSETSLAQNSILSLRKLIAALMITEKEDLMIHCILVVGHILKLCTQRPIQKGTQIFIKTTQKPVMEQYCQILQQNCRQYCKQLNLGETMVVIGNNCLKNPNFPSYMQYFVTSTPVNICILFMKCLTYQWFKNILSTRIYEFDYRFQVGWNFWEGRKVRFVNNQYTKYRLKGIKGRNIKSNECVIVWDEKREIVIVMADCKVNMHWRDIQRVQYWIDKHVPRFSAKYALNLTSYPTDTQKFHHIN